MGLNIVAHNEGLEYGRVFLRNHLNRIKDTDAHERREIIDALKQFRQKFTPEEWTDWDGGNKEFGCAIEVVRFVFRDLRMDDNAAEVAAGVWSRNFLIPNTAALNNRDVVKGFLDAVASYKFDEAPPNES